MEGKRVENDDMLNYLKYSPLEPIKENDLCGFDHFVVVRCFNNSGGGGGDATLKSAP